MKNRTLLIVFVIAFVVLALSVTGYLLTRKSVSPSGKSVNSVKTESASDPIQGNATKATPPAATPSSLTAVETKRYANAKYGFSFLMPKDYWYEEADGTTWDVGPVFIIAIERPGLAPEEIGQSDGTTAMSKYGILMSVSVCDRSLDRGKCLVDGRIDGLTFSSERKAVLGGRDAMAFDDLAYTVVTDKYEYAITLDPPLRDTIGPSDLESMKRAFEGIVQTIRFE